MKSEEKATRVLNVIKVIKSLLFHLLETLSTAIVEQW